MPGGHTVGAPDPGRTRASRWPVVHEYTVTSPAPIQRAAAG